MGGKGKSIVIVEDKESSDAGAAAADNVQKEQLRYVIVFPYALLGDALHCPSYKLPRLACPSPSSPPRHEHCAPCPPPHVIL
jgi:hypothetical protein